MVAIVETPLEQRVKEIMSVVLLIDEEQLTPQSRLRDDLDADSLDRIEFAMYLEEELLHGKELSDETVDAWVTVQDVVDSIKQAVPRKNRA